MNKENVIQLLQDYKNGKKTEEGVWSAISGFSRGKDHIVDIDRKKRTGCTEVIFGQNKSLEQILNISQKIVEHAGSLLVTRCKQEILHELKNKYPSGEINEIAKCFRLGQNANYKSEIAVLCAGTSDLPVAEEAKETALYVGAKVKTLYDCGVAGIHRLLHHFEQFEHVKAFVVVAGMEGALPSVVGGLASVPVIAVPTSVGYGASFQGLSALLGMLNSCANGITVVNIDNGYGAGYSAALIAKIADGSSV